MGYIAAFALGVIVALACVSFAQVKEEPALKKPIPIEDREQIIHIHVLDKSMCTWPT